MTGRKRRAVRLSGAVVAVREYAQGLWKDRNLYRAFIVRFTARVPGRRECCRILEI